MATEGVGFLARLGAWAGRRAEPRLWISLAGAGCALAVVGVVIISGDAQVGEEGFDDGSRVPGIILCLVVAAAGYVLLHLFAESPAATAGVTAIALAVPPLFYFLTFDGDGVPGGVALGIVLVIADAMEESSPTSIGIALLIVGGAVALGAQLLHLQTGEPPQMTPGPSVFGRPGPPAGQQAAWQPPAPWPQPPSTPPAPWQQPPPSPPPASPQPPPSPPLPPPPPAN
jgi:hypothetical protein